MAVDTDVVVTVGDFRNLVLKLSCSQRKTCPYDTSFLRDSVNPFEELSDGKKTLYDAMNYYCWKEEGFNCSYHFSKDKLI